MEKEAAVTGPAYAKEHIFVFGSNLAGRHGKGAALTAKEKHGAIYGQGTGRQGNSYAIPTKDGELNVLPLPAIEFHIQAFIQYAAAHPDLAFGVTPIGCGLAGYTDTFIAPLFAAAPDNCTLPEGWRDIAGVITPGRIQQDVYTILKSRYKKMAEDTPLAKKINSMMDAVAQNCGQWPADKTGRFVGYVQCLLIELCNKTTINSERDFTRPLFHKLYELQGIAIPDTTEA